MLLRLCSGDLRSCNRVSFDAQRTELSMNQNAPLWQNGQTPSSSDSNSSSENKAEEQARQQNQKSKSNKRSH